MTGAEKVAAAIAQHRAAARVWLVYATVNLAIALGCVALATLLPLPWWMRVVLAGFALISAALAAGAWFHRQDARCEADLLERVSR